MENRVFHELLGPDDYIYLPCRENRKTRTPDISSANGRVKALRASFATLRPYG